MATAEPLDPAAAVPSKKASKLGGLLSILLFCAGAAVSFLAVSFDLLPLGDGTAAVKPDQDTPPGRPDVAFVEIPALVITLPPGGRDDHLRFSGQIEVPAAYRKDVEFLMPRIQDVLNGYLRALSVQDIEGPGALFKIRLQMFRRIVMVVGLGKANGLLVTEFILN
jgi:flagellar FliL protein